MFQMVFKLGLKENGADIKVILSEYKCARSGICFSSFYFVVHNLANRWRCASICQLM